MKVYRVETENRVFLAVAENRRYAPPMSQIGRSELFQVPELPLSKNAKQAYGKTRRGAEQRPSIIWAESRRLKEAKVGDRFRTRQIYSRVQRAKGEPSYCDFVGTVRYIPMRRLVRTESGQDSYRVRRYMERAEESSAPPIQVIETKDGKFNIVNGHHRAVAAWKLHRTKIKAVVWRRVAKTCKFPT